MYLAFNQSLIGSTIVTEEGNLTIMSLIDYDSMTHTFKLMVEDESGNAVNREFSDKQKYEVVESPDNYNNFKRVNPKKRG